MDAIEPQSDNVKWQQMQATLSLSCSRGGEVVLARTKLRKQQQQQQQQLCQDSCQGEGR